MMNIVYNTIKSTSRLQKNKALFLLLLAFAGITKALAQGYFDEFSVDKLKYEVVGREGKYVFVKVVGHVDGEKARGDIVIPNVLSWEGEECLITRIGFFAFENCKEITSVNIPNSVTQIESKAFYGCSRLTSVTIPNSVVRIGEQAFTNTGWYDMQPDGILYLDNCCLGYKGDKPRGTLILEENTRLIADKAFFESTDLTGSLVIPNMVTTIGSEAFWGCGGFNGNIIIGRSVIEIHQGAFENCNGLVGDLKIPLSVKLIDICAFKNCSGLDGDLVIENPNTKMEGDVFSGCIKLTKRNTEKRYRYGGDFKMKGFGFDGTESVDANAVYEYYKSPDDTRIFDGIFCFGSRGSFNWTAFEHNQDLLAENISFEDIKKIYDEFDGMCIVLGRFSQDKQVGKWIWISKYQGSRSIQVCTINFNENGVPEGDFEIYHLYKASFEQRNGYYKYPEYHKRSYISGTIIDGVIVFIDFKEGYDTQISCNGETTYPSKVSGHYNKDGYPIGQWSFIGSDYTDYGRNVVVAFDDNGKCIKNYRTDPTTGDKIGLSDKMQAMPIRMASKALSYISNRFFRSTNVRRWPQKHITKYEYY